MKSFLTILFSLFLTDSINSQTATYNALLNTHVDGKENVNYKMLKIDESKLTEYIRYLENTAPQKNWSKNKSKAFWINAYNAYTLKTILDKYPLKSITNIKEKGKDAWNIPFANVGGEMYTLNHIEHKILRKNFNDPRIHVGVNCASVSCPQLGGFAFTEDNIDEKLEDLMKIFINDSNRNKITQKKIQLSKIFDWYKDDFTKNGSLIDYLNKYSTIKINKKAKIRFLEYDWNLNGK
ncbi:hypothetical protein KCTC32516_01164 [Polaribacter huanghezhanensis]|uniref:DUF547 domain-containing protein n=1 Tax=Polaribacter huanghezhanensis TaxID=1354726 RepID=UPI00264956B6|nr:DUF547 domain-containing protein [Polaribacter huanghezhanensis]WKD85818.1 hypothetical protein KCTC32516_01164 [Polaribacter huanghezhanensis]